MKCLCAELRRSARLLTRHYGKELEQAEMTPAQLELLGVLFARGGASQGALAEHLGIDQTTLSRNLKVMAARQWLERKTAKEDSRQASYSLSAEGRRALQRAEPHWERAQTEIRRALGSEWQATWAALERIGSSISR